MSKEQEVSSPPAFRCDSCGRFIPYRDIEKGMAVHRLLTPDSAFTSETYETLCREHANDRRTIERVFYCTDFDKEFGFPGCCHSCHDDAEDGYGELCERYEGQKLRVMVCCRVSEWLASKGIGVAQS